MKDKPIIKRKLVQDRKLPTPEQVGQRQNFKRINNDYSLTQKLLMKKILAWGGGIIGVAAITALVVMHRNSTPALQLQKPEEVKSIAAAPTRKPCVLSPLPAKEEPFANFKISVKDGGTITYKTGSVLKIPANAFLLNGAKPTSDSITIRYREFHDPLSIFLSGIPMKYDSAGTAYTLESAGMLEILAFDGDQPVKLNAATPIAISMASNSDDKNVNLYQLDTIGGNWVYKGKDKIVKTENGPTAQKVNPVAEKPIADNSIKPVLSTPQKYCFKIGYDKTDFPELAAYDNVQFQVTDNSFKPVYYKVNWSKISLTSSDVKGTYIVKLKKADTTISVSAVPVFDQSNYAAAMTKFEEKQKQATEKQNQTDATNKSKLDKVNKELASYSRNNMKAAANNTANISRVFMISQLGIHNCDSPIPPSPMQALVNNLNQEAKENNAAKKIIYSTIYLVEQGKNTVFRFAKGEPVKFDASSKKLMWTVTGNNEIAFFRNVDFKNGSTINLTPIPAKNQESAMQEIKKFSE